ncbi:MAG: NUDIX hydrolase [Anaerolineae bacterium]|nr:NUDIX hydrolase [Anaerolineae bacterium]
MQSLSTPETNAILSTHLEVRVVIFSLDTRGLQVLLRPLADPQHPIWELPGQAVGLDQSLDESASHCLTHYSGLQESYLEQLYTYGDVKRCHEKRLVSVVYFALIPLDKAIFKSPDHACWHAVEKLPDLLLDTGDILAYALRRLRYKLEYSAVGFELLPDNFSLSELQSTYEKILGEKLDKRNFRKRILKADIIEPTPHQRLGEGRPARLYRYRPDAVAEVKTRRLFP